MFKKKSTQTGETPKIRREPLTDTNLLMTITICLFVIMYVAAMRIWGAGFLNPQQVANMFNNNAWLIIIACGLTMVMISGSIDISVGGIVALVTMACALELQPGGSIAVSIALAIGIGLAFGIIQGYLIAYLEIQPFIVTMAGMFFARGYLTILSINPVKAGLDSFMALHELRFDLPFIGTYGKAGNFIPTRLDPSALVAIAIVLIVFVILRWTRLGRDLYAIGGNKQSALMLGINVKRTKFYAHVLSGLLAGIAGYVFLMDTAAGSFANAMFGEMKAIAASIIGGTLLTGGVGNVIGTLFGVLTLLTIDNVVRVVPQLREPWWQEITTGAMLTFFLLMQSIVLWRRGKGDLGKFIQRIKSKTG